MGRSLFCVRGSLRQIELYYSSTNPAFASSLSNERVNYDKRSFIYLFIYLFVGCGSWYDPLTIERIVIRSCLSNNPSAVRAVSLSVLRSL
jgi:hypothetical protein